MVKTEIKTCEYCASRVLNLKQHQKTNKCKAQQEKCEIISNSNPHTNLRTLPDITISKPVNNSFKVNYNSFKTLNDSPHFQVNKYGDIYNKQTDNLVTPQKNKNTGTYSVNIQGEKKTLSKLVYQYHGQYPSLLKHFTLDHLDGDFTNDYIDNLAPKRVIVSGKRNHIFIIRYDNDNKEFECYLNINIRNKNDDEESYMMHSFEATEELPKEFQNFIANITNIKQDLNRLEKDEIAYDDMLRHLTIYIVHPDSKLLRFK